MKHLFPFVSESVEATISFGKTFSTFLKSGDVIAIYGNLGAGKTHFVKGICEGFGVNPDKVNSPTFTIVNEYDTSLFPIYHFDAYRIKDTHEFYEIGYEEYLYQEAICLIEWPQLLESLLPEQTIHVELSHQDESRRILNLKKL